MSGFQSMSFLVLLSLGFLGLILVWLLIWIFCRMVVVNGTRVYGDRMWKWGNRLCFCFAVFVFAGVGLMGSGFGRGISAEQNKSSAFFRGIFAALELYHETNGEYPSPRAKDVPVEIDGHIYNATGALMLYQALSGDGDDNLQLAAGREAASDGKFSDAELSSAFMKNMPQEWVRKIDEGYIFIDGFGHPFQFTPGGKDSVNETYDLWSYGEAMPPVKEDKAAKQNPAVSGKWIKNW